MSNSVRVYELFPGASGLSNRTVDYSGTIVAVAATSISQAHALAHKKVWATDAEKPLGILWVHRKGEEPDHQLFNGTTAYGSQIRNGARKRAIVAWMRSVLEV